MFDPETFVTAVYVLVDTFVQQQPGPVRRPGPPASLSPSEVITLAIAGQWACFRTEEAFYRYADRHLRGAFPRLPSRPQLNRHLRHQRDAITAFGRWLADALGAATAPYEVLDSTGVPTRNRQRPGPGWLAGISDIGRCGRLGWYEGVHLLVATTPDGVITGYGFGAASTQDRTLAETFFALRAQPAPRLPECGPPAPGGYLADTGFAGRQRHARWHATYGVTVVAPPQANSRRAWSAAWRKWLARRRQVVESVFDRLLGACRLERERPHDLTGFRARLAAKVALHNSCCWLNRSHARPLLAFADLVDW